jgi:hypothetical protein
MVCLILVLCLLTGCHGNLGPDASQSEADKALQTALAAWKVGKTQAELEKGVPSIIMNEDDWRIGKRLLDYNVQESSLSGRQIRCRVHIKLQDQTNKTVEQDAVYIIDTTPRIVIVRDTFASFTPQQ